MNQPPEPPSTAFQSVSSPDSKSSITIILSSAGTSIFGSSLQAAKERLSAAERNSALASVALQSSRVFRMSRRAPVRRARLDVPSQPHGGDQVLDRAARISPHSARVHSIAPHAAV